MINSGVTIGSAPHKVRLKLVPVVVIGDSTVYPGTTGPFGWGSRLESVFPSDLLDVNNKAISGASSKSFNNIYWDDTVTELSAASCLLIQFGHNDSNSSDPARYTTTGTAPDWTGTYRDQLELMINASEALGTQVIVCSSVSHMTFDDSAVSGSVVRPRIEPPNVGDGESNYPAAAIAIATSNGLESIDLQSSTRAVFQRLGKAPTHTLYQQTPADETHYTLEGSRHVADIIRRSLASGSSRLQHIAAYSPIVITNHNAIMGRIWVGGTYSITGTVISGGTVSVYWVSPDASSSNLLGVANITGQTWSFSWTPSTAYGIGWLEARCSSGNSGRVPVDVKAIPNVANCHAFWDADYGCILSGSDMSSWTSVIGNETWSAVSLPNDSYLSPTQVATRRALNFTAASSEYMINDSTTFRDLLRNSDATNLSIVWRGRLTTSGYLLSWGDSDSTSYYSGVNIGTYMSWTARGNGDAVAVTATSSWPRDGSVIHTWGMTWSRGATDTCIWYQDGIADTAGTDPCVVGDMSVIDYCTLGCLARGNNHGTRASYYDGTIRQLWIGPTALDAAAHAAIHETFLYF